MIPQRVTRIRCRKRPHGLILGLIIADPALFSMHYANHEICDEVSMQNIEGTLLTNLYLSWDYKSHDDSIIDSDTVARRMDWLAHMPQS